MAGVVGGSTTHFSRSDFCRIFLSTANCQDASYFKEERWTGTLQSSVKTEQSRGNAGRGHGRGNRRNGGRGCQRSSSSRSSNTTNCQ